jgi:hypothetical protein
VERQGWIYTHFVDIKPKELHTRATSQEVSYVENGRTL